MTANSNSVQCGSRTASGRVGWNSAGPPAAMGAAAMFQPQYLRRRGRHTLQLLLLRGLLVYLFGCGGSGDGGIVSQPLRGATATPVTPLIAESAQTVTRAL